MRRLEHPRAGEPNAGERALGRDFLGIAETARVVAVAGRKKAEDTASRPGVANALAEMEILMATSQNNLGRHGEDLDSFMR